MLALMHGHGDFGRFFSFSRCLPLLLGLDTVLGEVARMTRALAGLISFVLAPRLSASALSLLLWMKLEAVFGSVAFLATMTALRNVAIANSLGRLRLSITNGGNISAVRLDHIKDVQLLSVLRIVDVVGNPELYSLAPALERLHNL